MAGRRNAEKPKVNLICFHGDTLEWVGALRAALEASGTFTMIELGAGWAPWCVIGTIGNWKTSISA